jgi:hypothetical protein
MRQIFTIQLLIILTINSNCYGQTDQGDSEFIKGVVTTLTTNNKKDFQEKYIPTMNLLLELSYGKSIDSISDSEKEGFNKTSKVTLDYLQENMNSSFDFVKDKLKDKGLSSKSTIEIIKAKERKFLKSTVIDFYVSIAEGKNNFKIELLGCYRMKDGWRITEDIAPSYF